MESLKQTLRRINSLPTKTFETSYYPTYRHIVHNHVANDPQHPRYEVQKRRVQDRKEEGVWWFFTVPAALSKSKCVRGWAKRRVKTAVTEELRLRGYDETGKLIHAAAMQQNSRAAKARRLKSPMELSGSVRLHIQPTILRAKHTQVREQAGNLIDALMHSGTASR